LEGYYRMTTSDLPKKSTLVWIWLSLRVYTLLCGVVAARMAGALLATIWERWDAVYYARIASVGYSAGDGTTTFHPLFPWLARPIALLSGAPIVGLLLVSSIATLALYFAFERLALIDQNGVNARRSTLLFIFWPVSSVLYLPYSESLWLMCAVVSLICARRERWWRAGLAAAMATLTRQQGLFLIVPLAWELWLAVGSDFKQAVVRWRDWLALTLIPLAYLGWIVYRTLALGDVNPDFSSFRRLIDSTLLSPASHRIVREHGFIWPWEATYLAVKRALTLSYVNPWVDLILGFLFLLLIVLAWRGMRASYRIYVTLIAIVSFSFHTGMSPTGGAYLSLPRHLLLAFPVFIGLGAGWRKLPSTILIAAGTVAMTFLLFGYFWIRLVP
jgi:hypothetical protein